jgi:uncharacterized damage-inducible protein DinB
MQNADRYDSAVYETDEKPLSGLRLQVMTLTDYFLAQLESEAPKTRRALQNAPAGKDDWKPHDKSMPFGRLAALVARMPSWVTLIVKQDALDLNPVGGSNIPQTPLRTAAELVKAHDDAVAEAIATLKSTSDDQLMKHWKLQVSGNTVSDQPRHLVLRDTFMHWSHHRGQFTVYLRMNGAAVPAIYGPSADDQRFE